MEQFAETCRFILSCNYSSKIVEAIQSRCAVFRFRPLDSEKVLEKVMEVANSEGVEMEEEAARAIADVSLGSKEGDYLSAGGCIARPPRYSRSCYETTATAPGGVAWILSCLQRGWFPAWEEDEGVTRSLRTSGTDLVNQLHRELGKVTFLDEPQKLKVTEAMAECDFRMVEGGGESLQLDAMAARICSMLGN